MMNIKQFAIGSLVFLEGILFYVFYRTGVEAFEVMGLGHIRVEFLIIHKQILGNLPSLLHTISFSVVTASVISNSKLNFLRSCSFWVLVNIIFELGQYYKDLAISLIPSFVLLNLPSFISLQNFFIRGTFDIGDIVASVVGGLIAYAILTFTTNGRLHYAS